MGVRGELVSLLGILSKFIAFDDIQAPASAGAFFISLTLSGAMVESTVRGTA